MGEAYPMETVDRAQELYCLDELTLEETARTVGVAASTVKRLSTEYGWAEKRRALRAARLDIKEKTVRLRADLLRRCLETEAGGNPLNLFAVAKLEEAAVKAAEFELKARREQLAAESQAAPEREISTVGEALDALDEAVRRALNGMLQSRDGVSLARIKELAACFDLAKDLRARHGQAESEAARARGLDGDTANLIRAALSLPS